jgi:hypothetical protein
MSKVEDLSTINAMTTVTEGAELIDFKRMPTKVDKKIVYRIRKFAIASNRFYVDAEAGE